MQKLMLVLNPVSGKLKGIGKRDALVEQLSKTYDVDVFQTNARGDGTLLTLAHIKDYDAVAACGGDGTLNEVMTALYGLPEEQHKPVLCIPAGTTNLMGDTLGLPKDVVKAAEINANGTAQPFDLGLFNEHCFGSVVAFGAFTDSSYAAPQKIKNKLGYGAYVLGGARSLFKLRSYDMTVTVNGETIRDKFIFGGIANCVAVGGIIRFQDGVVQTGDGKYEVVFIRRLRTPAAVARVVRAITKHQYENCPEILVCQADAVTIHCEKPVAWSIDGEYKGDVAHAEIRILPGLLQVVQ